MREQTYRVAMGGIVTAGAVVILFMGAVIPFATFAAPCMAALCVLYFAIEYTTGAAFAVYAAIALLSVLLVPDKEMALLFACFFGYYPVAKKVIETKLPRPTILAAKLVLFNAAICGLYYVITKLFVLEVVAQEFAAYTGFFTVLLLAMGNVVFILYDILLSRAVVLYRLRLRPRLIKK